MAQLSTQRRQVEITRALERLLQTSIDRKIGYDGASSSATGEGARRLFFDLAKQSAQFVGELEAALVNLGASPAPTAGTLGAAVRRGWIDFRRALDGTDAVLITACLRGEGGALAAYERVLQSASFDGAPRALAIVQRQFAALQGARDTLERAVATYAAAPPSGSHP